jgi:hypothetical protein
MWTLSLNLISTSEESKQRIQNQHQKLRHTICIAAQIIFDDKCPPGGPQAKLEKKIVVGDHIDFCRQK